MENESVLIAYHESARVVFAYLNGYSCDSIELPGKGSNRPSKLNAGSDTPFVQAVLSGSPLAPPQENDQHVIEVAKKLMTIYCAGTCAKIFFQNDLKIPAELELDISGQDLAMMEKIQTFLKKASADHPVDFPSQAIASVFRKLKDPDVWKGIELLVKKSQQKTTVTQYDIVDALMQAGIPIQRPTAKAGSGLGLTEDNTKPEPPQPKASSFAIPDVSPLDIVVKDFLKKIKTDLSEEELNAATTYLHGVYKRYGQ